MKPTPRLTFLGALAVVTLAVIWVVGRRPTPGQAATLRPILDRATEAKAAVDRVGQELVKVPDPEEVELGRRLLEQEPGLPKSSPPAFARQQAFLDDVLARLVRNGGLRRPGMPYRAQLMEHGSINAFALPGGRIFVTTALLEFAENEAEVAAILGHEMAHVDLRHCIERYQYELRAKRLGGAPLEAMATLGGRMMLQGYQDEQEAEADRWGMQLAAHAGYHPQAAQRFMARLEGRSGPESALRHLSGEAVNAMQDAIEDYFISHPRGALRIANLERAMNEAQLDPEQNHYYLGAKNRAGFISRNKQEFSGESVQKRIYP